MPVYQADGRRADVRCWCGEDDLLAHVDPVDGTVYLRCPECDVDILEGQTIASKVRLTFHTDDLDDVDPALRAQVAGVLEGEPGGDDDATR